MSSRFCPACGTVCPVGSAPVQLPDGAVIEATLCAHCGLCLDELATGVHTPLEHAVVAEDAGFIARAVVDALLRSGIVRTVDLAADGLELVAVFTRYAQARQAIDLAVVDIEMPRLSGLAAARMARAIEHKHELAPAALIFLSGVVCDPALRQQIQAFAPAYYINKGNLASVDELPVRLGPLVARIQAERRAR